MVEVPYLNNMANTVLSSSSSGIMVSNRGDKRHERRGHESQDVLPRYGRDAHCPHHLETIRQIGEGLDVAATYERLIGRRTAAQPFGVELSHVTLGERAILAQALPLRLSQLRRKNQKRAEDHAQQKDDQGGDLGLELRQCGPEEENAVGERSGKQGALRDGEHGVGMDRRRKENRDHRRDPDA
jgi:hypothetical protein